ncbi:MAG TPA: RES family NAD+ phosphorylase [Pyrinomonadaceae bacterium]|nr:RES family NAD+ phosphorylase [Pyrinomonadaceae bacterium]
MHVWRLASRRHEPLGGDGAGRAGGRWNSPGRPLVYTSESIALCLAECLVHVTGQLPSDYHVFEIAVPDAAIEYLDISTLKKAWQRNLGDTRAVGGQWLISKRTLALVVPSAVLPKSMNVLLNPTHPRSGELRIVDRQPFRFDPRLGR